MTNIKTKGFDFNKIIFFVVILAAMNFMLYGSYLIMIAFGIYLVFNRGKFIITIPALSLVFLVCSYILFDILSSGSMNLRIVAAPCAYILAYNLIPNDRYYDFCDVLTLISYSMAAHSIVSFIYSISVFGFSGFVEGVSYDMWSGDVSAATGVAAYYFFTATLVPLVIMRPNWHNILLLIITCVHDILIGGRTYLILLTVSLALTLIGKIVVSKHKIATILKYCLVVGIIAAFLIYIYQNNVWNIKSMFESSYLYERFFSDNPQGELFQTSRWERKLIYLQNLLEYPFGGNHIRNDLSVGYAHDIWLDTFDRSGLLTLFILLLYTISSIIRFFKCAIKTNDCLHKKIILIVFPIVLMLAFLVEPIMEGAPMVFFMYCFMDGVISKKLDVCRGNI